MAVLERSVDQGLFRVPVSEQPLRVGGAKPTATRRISRFLGYALLVVAAIAVITPFFWMVVSSLKPTNDVFSAPVKWFPDSVVWSNYVTLWSETEMLTWTRNTLLLSIVITFLQLLTGSFAAYGFARVRFPGRDVLFLLYIGTIAVPWQSYMIPQFVLMSDFKLTNTLWAVVLLQAFSAFGVFLMKQYYETIPEELSEAARIDGMSEYGIWYRIMLPLSVPALSSLGLLTFVHTWNDYMGPLLYLRNNDLWTLQLGLQSFVSDMNQPDFAMLFAGLTLSVIPIAVVFALGQRFFIEGIATSGMKG